jgi:hypothetical protein
MRSHPGKFKILKSLRRFTDTLEFYCYNILILLFQMNRPFPDAVAKKILLDVSLGQHFLHHMGRVH